MSYIPNNGTRINSIIGRKIEGIKVEVKRAKEDLTRIYRKSNLNKYELFLINNGSEIINRCDQSLRDFKNINFINLARRSMKKNELCLGRIDEGNLRVMEGIEIGNLRGLYYNLIEEDVYEYLKRVRRKNPSINLDEVVDKYISISNLTEDSRRYLKILLDIPYDTLRQWRKYRNNKKNLSIEEYLDGISKSFKYEFN